MFLKIVIQSGMKRFEFAHGCTPASRAFSPASVKWWELARLRADRGFDSLGEAVTAPAMIKFYLCMRLIRRVYYFPSCCCLPSRRYLKISCKASRASHPWNRPRGACKSKTRTMQSSSESRFQLQAETYFIIQGDVAAKGRSLSFLSSFRGPREVKAKWQAQLQT